MTITGWPFQGTTVSDAQWALLMSLLSRSGGLDGVSASGHFVVAVSSGLTVSVTAGDLLACGHGVSSSASENVTLDAAHATLTRIDRVVARLDMVAKTAALGFVKGTPSGSPTAPTLTQDTSATYEVLLADVTVPPGVSTLVSGNVEDRRRVLVVDTDGIQAADITDSTSVGRAVLTASDASASRSAIGAQVAGSYAAASHTHPASQISDSTSLGRSILTASDRAAVLTALGLSAPVKALLDASTAVQMREAMRFFKNGATFTPAADDLKYTDL